MSYQNNKIIIIDNSNLSYNGEDIDGNVIRGTETSLILWSQFTNEHECDFCNCIDKHSKINGVNYFHKDDIDKKIYDLAIVISDKMNLNAFRL